MQRVMLRTERQKKIPYGIEAHCGFGAPQSMQSVGDNDTLALVPLIAAGSIEPVPTRTVHTLIAQIFPFHEREQFRFEVGFSHAGSRAKRWPGCQ